MATTLVIKEANFSTNALTTVVLDTSIPCTGVSLNESTLALTYGNTGELVATVTPTNTTDLATWTSSDTNVATVNNGVVTATGVGSATITVTCGSYSDSCVVSVTANMNTANLLKRVGYYMSGNTVASGGNGLPTWYTTNVERGGLASTTGELTYTSDDARPYKMPNNTAIVKITIKSGSKVALHNVQWFNDQTSATGSATTACLLDATGADTQTPTTDGQGNTVYTITVPTNTHPINMLGVGVKTKNYTTLTIEQLDDVTVEFLPSV